MNYTIVISAIFLVSASARDPRCPILGENDGATHVEHESDCTKFYKCDLIGNLVEIDCYPGTEYYPELRVCGWPTGKCDVFSRLDHQANDLPEGCDPKEDPENPTHLPHPTRCDVFYKCSLGTPVLHQCPSNLHWNIEKNFCDWASEANCVRPLTHVSNETVEQKDEELPEGCDPNENPENPTHLPHPTRCDVFYKCSLGTPVLHQCPSNLHWNIEKNFCDWASEANCVRPLTPVSDETVEQKDEELPEGCDPNENPENPTHLPHPTRCDVFYKCSLGTPVLHQCPSNLHWNIEKNFCDWASEANCVRPLTPVSNGTVEQKDDDLPEGCDPNENPENPTHLPHPTRCDVFYKCSLGTPVLHQCPSNLHWNIEKNFCDWASEANCVRPLTPVSNGTVEQKDDELPKGCDPNENPENPTHLPHPTRCDVFYKCSLGTPVLHQCPSNLHWNIEKNFCDWASEANCVRPLTPVSNGTVEQKDDELPKGCDPNENPENPTHLPHPTRCDVFYKCSKGIPVIIECPSNLHWNIEKNYCDWIWEAKCVRPLI